MTTYTTTFPSTENPISEGGEWENTVSVTWSHPVTTTGGSPGTAQGPSSASINDAVARLKNGSWGRAQDVSLTASVPGSPTGNPELESHLHMTMTTGPDNITTYEGDYPWNVNKWDFFIVRWDGGQGTFSVLNSGSVLNTPVDGDVLEMKDDGSGNFDTLLNGSTTGITAGPDTTYTTGNPGIGFDNDTSSVVCKGYTATDGVTIVAAYLDPAFLI